MRLHWSKIRYYQKFWEQFQQKGSPYENFSFFYQFRLDESLILSKEEKEKKKSPEYVGKDNIDFHLE